MIVLFLVAVLILLFFIPIPIKISAIYDNRLLSIRIYNHKVELKNKHEIKDDTKEALSKDIYLRQIFNFLHKNRFKPSSRLKFKLVYGFGDAAYTGIFYGIIHTVYPLLLELIKSIITVRNSKFILKPEFDETILNAEINSIIFVSLVQVIYISINILRIMKKHIEI